MQLSGTAEHSWGHDIIIYLTLIQTHVLLNSSRLHLQQFKQIKKNNHQAQKIKSALSLQSHRMSAPALQQLSDSTQTHTSVSQDKHTQPLSLYYKEHKKAKTDKLAQSCEAYKRNRGEVRRCKVFKMCQSWVRHRVRVYVQEQRICTPCVELTKRQMQTQSGGLNHPCAVTVGAGGDRRRRRAESGPCKQCDAVKKKQEVVSP